MVVWDESKRATNLLKHGLDFADFDDAFDIETAVAAEAKPSRDGRRRFKLVGLWNRTTVVVAIVSPLGSEALALISLRPANRKEKAL